MPAEILFAAVADISVVKVVDDVVLRRFVALLVLELLAERTFGRFLGVIAVVVVEVSGR